MSKTGAKSVQLPDDDDKRYPEYDDYKAKEAEKKAYHVLCEKVGPRYNTMTGKKLVKPFVLKVAPSMINETRKHWPAVGIVEIRVLHDPKTV